MKLGQQAAAQSIPVVAAVSTSADAGHNIAVSTTGATRATSQATTIGEAEFSAPLVNTAPIYLGKGSGVTVSTGIELLPGDSKRLPCANANEWYAITGTATQNCHVVAL